MLYYHRNGKLLNQLLGEYKTPQKEKEVLRTFIIIISKRKKCCKGHSESGDMVVVVEEGNRVFPES